MSNRYIPSEEDFARANAADEKRNRGLSQVRDTIRARFHKGGKLHEIFLFSSSEHSIWARVFYRWERQIDEAEKSGLADEIRTAVLEALEKERGGEGAINVNFEFDSHENVEQNYGGNYFNRLR